MRLRASMVVAACAVIAAALLASGGVLPFNATSATSASAQQVPWSVTATPTTGLTDGQRVTMNVKAGPGTTIYAAEATLCRSGVTYQSSVDDVRPPDSQPGGPNCPPVPISTNGDTVTVTTSTYQNAGTPEGETFSFRAGAGVVSWDRNPDRVPVSLTCGANDPCALVVKLYVQVAGGTAHWEPSVHPLAYRIDDPIAGCGGPADGLLASGASDRMAPAWVAWTLAACARPGQSGAASGATFLGEGKAIGLFGDRSLDLAYSAVGYHPEAGLAPAEDHPGGLRPAVRVPIAMNATVLAVSNGARGSNGKNVPYTDVKLTLEEAAALLSGGTYDMAGRLDAIYARNPQLAATGFFNTSSGFQVAASAEADGTSWLATRHFDVLRPNEWKVPNLPGVFGSDAGQPRGADAGLAVASPSYAQALSLFSGRTVLEKNLNTNDFGGIWVLTDLSTARSLGLTPVSLENAAGEFVEPTPESLAAALPTLRATPDGTLLPDPAAVRAGQGPGAAAPYPLTYVEYAYAPAEPLVDLACTLRPQSQALLTDWLTYLTGPGQAALPDGFVALPPPLAAEAASAIPKVGSAPLPCTPPPGPPATDADPDLTGGAGGPLDPGTELGFPTGGPDLSSDADLGGTADGVGGVEGASGYDAGSFDGSGQGDGGSAPGSGAAGAGDEALAVAATRPVPPFAGAGGSGVTSALIALVVITAAISAAAMASSRLAPTRTPRSGSAGGS